MERQYREQARGCPLHEGPVSYTHLDVYKRQPKHYTEDTLLSAMETAGAKDMPEDAERKGIGLSLIHIYNLSETVIVPIAGVILAFVMTL